MNVLLEFDELVHIAISMLAISIAFTLVFAGPEGLLRAPTQFFLFALMSMATVGSGFVLHEMGHKLTAIYFGGQSKFRMWPQGLLFMLVVSLFGVLFAAPGAVYIYLNKITKKQNGLISIAGPAINLLLVGFFLLLAWLYPIRMYFPFIPDANGLVNVWYFGAQMNLLLALFNMIPAFPLDGSKVWDWSKLVWGGTTAGLLAMQALIFSPMLVISWLLMFALVFIASKLLFRR
ncbi:MAG: site-2 protease family protein [Candidatus Micrarchaeota archaeon]